MRWCPQNELLCSAEIPVVGCLACNVVTLRRCVTDRGNERMALTSSNHQPPSFLYHHSVASHSFASSQRHLRPRFCLLTFFAIHILFQVELLLLSKVLYETDKCLFCAFLLFVIERQPEIAINCTFFYGKGSWISLISAERELSYCHQTLYLLVSLPFCAHVGFYQLLSRSWSSHIVVVVVRTMPQMYCSNIPWMSFLNIATVVANRAN